MKNFVVIYNAPVSAMQANANATSTPEEMGEVMDMWMAWAERCGDMMVDMGSPLDNCVQVCMPGTVCGENTVCGYSVMRAACMEDVQAMMEGHPHTAMNPACWITVCEAMPVMAPATV